MFESVHVSIMYLKCQKERIYNHSAVWENNSWMFDQVFIVLQEPKYFTTQYTLNIITSISKSHSQRRFSIH